MGLFADQKRYTLPNGMTIATLSDLSAIAAYREVMADEIYLKHGITLNDGDCVFDVGANIGLFKLFAHQKCRNLQVFVVVEADEGAGVYVYMLYATRLQPETLMATKMTANKPTLSTSDLRAFLKERLPKYMIPSTFVMMNALPLTPNSKIDRRALPAPEIIRPELQVSYVAPKTEVEKAIASIWKEVLQLEKVGINDNFFDLGGTSLLIVQARTKLREELGYDISLVELFKYPTIDSLVKHLHQEQNERASIQQLNERAKKQTEALKQTEYINRQKQFMEARRQKNRH